MRFTSLLALALFAMVSVASIGCAPADAPATPDTPAVTEGEGEGSAKKMVDDAAAAASDAATEMKDKAVDAVKDGSGTQ